MKEKPSAALCTVENSLVVFIDIQERLIAAIEGKSAASVVNNASRLLQAAHALSVPVLFTEQSPGKLGNTHPTLLEARPPESRMVEKTSFSACEQDEFIRYLELSGRNEIIICGMETHVCVLQTTFDLLGRGYTVSVVEDAVCSRTTDNKNNEGIPNLHPSDGDFEQKLS